MNLRRTTVVFSIILILIQLECLAAEKKFVSTKTNKVNVRVGPGARYKILWTFVSKHEPLEVLQEYQNWKKIKYIDGEEGWVMSNMLTHKRFVIVTSDTDIHKNEDLKIKIAFVKANVRCSLLSHKSDLAKIECKGYRGFTKSQNLWGL